MKERWNERYANPEYAYGEEPNAYFKLQLDKLTPGSILMPAEGEGRNAVYAATKGWAVDAFDQSDAGRDKALALAERNDTKITYQVGELHEVSYAANSYDAIGLIYAHFPAAVKSAYHKELIKYLKPGGHVIFEAFSKNHLAYKKADPKVGGPDDIDMLFSIEEIQHDFEGFEITELKEEVIELKEGLYHMGKGSVIRFTGRKKL
jgi:SAM-dependent methyltransferase